MCSWTPSLLSSASAAGTASPAASRTALATLSASGTATATRSALATLSASGTATKSLTGTGTARVTRSASSSRVPSNVMRSASPSASPVTEPLVAGRLVFNVPIDAARLPIDASSFSETMLRDMTTALVSFFSASLKFSNVTEGSVSITRVSIEARRRALAEAGTTKVAFDYVVRVAALPPGGAGAAATLSAALAGNLPALVAALSSVRTVVQELGGAGGVLDLHSSYVVLPPPPCSGTDCPLTTQEVVLLAVLVPLAVLTLIVASYKWVLHKAATKKAPAPALALRSAGVDDAAPADAAPAPADAAPAPAGAAPAPAAPVVPDDAASRPAVAPAHREV